MLKYIYCYLSKNPVNLSNFQKFRMASTHRSRRGSYTPARLPHDGKCGKMRLPSPSIHAGFRGALHGASSGSGRFERRAFASKADRWENKSQVLWDLRKGRGGAPEFRHPDWSTHRGSVHRHRRAGALRCLRYFIPPHVWRNFNDRRSSSFHGVDARGITSCARGGELSRRLNHRQRWRSDRQGTKSRQLSRRPHLPRRDRRHSKRMPGTGFSRPVRVDALYGDGTLPDVLLVNRPGEYRNARSGRAPCRDEANRLWRLFRRKAPVHGESNRQSRHGRSGGRMRGP